MICKCHPRWYIVLADGFIHFGYDVFVKLCKVRLALVLNFAGPTPGEISLWTSTGDAVVKSMKRKSGGGRSQYPPQKKTNIRITDIVSP